MGTPLLPTCVLNMSVSIIVPAYCEQPNLRPLTERIFQELRAANITAEVIVVDDNSNDGSEETIAALASEGYPVSIIVRKHERGLSSAVVAGFLAAKHDVLVCMDADLQHDPGYLPAWWRPLWGGRPTFASAPATSRTGESKTGRSSGAPSRLAQPSSPARSPRAQTPCRASSASTRQPLPTPSDSTPWATRSASSSSSGAPPRTSGRSPSSFATEKQ